MNSPLLEKWFSNNQTRNKNFVPLMEGLIGPKGSRYLFYRLKYFANITWIKVVAHLIEFYLVYHVLGKASLAAVAILRGVFMTIKAGYWGFLEILRSKIRAQYDENTRIIIPHIIKAWLFLSLTIGLITSIIYFLLPLPSHSVFITCFSIALCVELSVQLLVFTFHSSTYALRRIVRPAASIYTLYAIELAILLACWPITGIYSLPIALVVTRFLSFYLTYFYTKRTGDLWVTEDTKTDYHITLKQCFAGTLSMEALLATLSMIVMHSEGAIILLLFVISLSNPMHAEPTIIFFFLISPVVLSSFSWARLLYFDFKKLEFFPLTSLCQRLLTRSFKASFLMGFLFWLLAVIIAFALYPAGKSYLGMLLPFFLLRCPIAILQIHAFSMRRYWDVLVSGALILGSLWSITTQQLSIDHVLHIVIVLMALSLLYLLFFSTTSIHYRSQNKTPKNIYDGIKAIKRLQQTNNQYTLAELQFSGTQTAFDITQLTRIVAKITKSSGITLQLDKYRCLFALRSLNTNTKQRLLKETAGCLTSFKIVELNTLFADTAKPSEPPIGSIEYRLDDKNKTLPTRMDYGELQRALRQLIKTPHEPAKTKAWYVSMRIDHQGIQAFYFLSTRYRNQRRIHQWHQYWVNQNIKTLLNTKKTERHQSLFRLKTRIV
ncbi:MAG: hypothetical protein CL816_02750 [Coxiellaceae bacterium]|nr:hypothetical protein [Coxiellaceae bacterium]